MSAPASFWDGIAESYARKPVDDPAAFERKIEITRGRMNPESVVLDIGCGTGSLALRLADAGAAVHGLDVSGEMLRIARQKAAAQGADNVTFHQGLFDETFTAFDDGGLDGLCAYSILHLVADRRAALAQVHRLLKPGGFFISSTVCLGGPRALLFWPLLGTMRLIGKAPMVKLFTRAALVRDIADAGFIDIEQPDVGAGSTIAFIVARKPA